jgi:hypothetical protein
MWEPVCGDGGSGNHNVINHHASRLTYADVSSRCRFVVGRFPGDTMNGYIPAIYHIVMWFMWYKLVTYRLI